MQRQQRIKLLSGAACSLLGIGATAAAEDATDESMHTRTSAVEEIVVTAQKRYESLQEVPIAVSAYTSEMRHLRGILNVPDLSDFTPGLNYSQGLGRMSLRGVGRLTNNYGSDPGVANYSDGFYTSSTVEAGKHPILIDRIEVGLLGLHFFDPLLGEKDAHPARIGRPLVLVELHSVTLS